MPYCTECGAKINEDDKYCTQCGALALYTSPQTKDVGTLSHGSPNINICPKCHSTRVSVQTFQEQKQSVTTGVSTTNIVEKKHGCAWWLFIGWWWVIIKGFLWIIAFIPMAIIRAGRRRKYQGITKTVNTTINNIDYKVVCTCHNCGNIWQRSN